MLPLGASVGETTGDLISITVFRGKFELRAFIYFGASVRVQGDHRPNKDGNGTSTIKTSNDGCEYMVLNTVFVSAMNISTLISDVLMQSPISKSVLQKKDCLSLTQNLHKLLASFLINS